MQRGNIRELNPQEGPPEVAELIAACMQREPLCRPSARDVCRCAEAAAQVKLCQPALPGHRPDLKLSWKDEPVHPSEMLTQT